jgi:hypothetical protein
LVHQVGQQPTTQLQSVQQSTQVQQNSQHLKQQSQQGQQKQASQQTTAVITADPNKHVPIHITLPAQTGAADSQPRVLTIQVPASALQGNQLHTVLTGPIIAATMVLPQHLASYLLQQHVTAALQGQTALGAYQMQQFATVGAVVAQNLISNGSLMADRNQPDCGVMFFSTEIHWLIATDLQPSDFRMDPCCQGQSFSSE